MSGSVLAVSRSATHTFRKPNTDSLELITGIGIIGDAHSGEKVKHRSRVKANPEQPNLRQVHLIRSELHDELYAKGFPVSAGQLGETITARGVDLLHVPKGTRLPLGSFAIVEVAGLRNPCAQIENFQSGLLKACLDKDDHGNLIRKTGVMSIVVADGVVKPGDIIHVELSTGPHQPLEVV